MLFLYASIIIINPVFVTGLQLALFDYVSHFLRCGLGHTVSRTLMLTHAGLCAPNTDWQSQSSSPREMFNQHKGVHSEKDRAKHMIKRTEALSQ